MNIRTLRAIVLGLVVLLPAPAFAAARLCYSPAELQAEQTLRLHSQLMVIAVTCRQGSRGQDLVRAYAAFTHDNITMLADAEHTLISYYKIRFHDDGISHLDTLRTQLGNESGQESADDTAPLFCRQYRDRVIALYYDSPAQVQKEVRQMVQTKKSYGALCRKVASNTPPMQVAKQTP
jgi:hypothetical protein